MADEQIMLLDDRRSGDYRALSGHTWRLITDGVMGGLSTGSLTPEAVAGRSCLHMRGTVRLDNNGGFIQIALDLSEEQRRRVSEYNGLLLDIQGNDSQYNIHLRTSEMRAPWQSFRASFQSSPEWRTVKLSFKTFEAHRYSGSLDPGTIRRIGIVAIGSAFTADLCVGRIGFYRE